MTSSSHHPHPGSHRKTSSQKQNISNGPTSSSSSKNYYIRLSYANKKNRSHFLWKNKKLPTLTLLPIVLPFLIRRGVAAPPEVKTADVLLGCWGWFVIVVLIKLILINCFSCWSSFVYFHPFSYDPSCECLPSRFPPAKGAHWSPGAARGLIEKLPSFSMQ